MPLVDFDRIPSHGRLWVFPSSRRLSAAEAGTLLAEVDAFLEGWAAHGAPLRCARALVDDHFLLVAVDEDASRPSGCSIDALVNRLEALGEGLGLRLVDHAPVWYREGAEVRVASREAFRELAAQGAVGPGTRVFDTALTRLADLRERGLERAAEQSWHGRAFFRPPGGAA